MDNVINAIFRMLDDADEVVLPDVDAERQVLEDEMKKEREEALEKCKFEKLNQSSCRAFASEAGFPGSNPRPRHTKVVKNGTCCLSVSPPCKLRT